jgi:hypothetical protein
MTKKPPMDLQSALAAAKAKLAEPPKRVLPSSVNRESQPKAPNPKLVKANKSQSQDEPALTLEKLAQAWVQTKNFPKGH